VLSAGFGESSQAEMPVGEAVVDAEDEGDAERPRT
jgi:hypothetical protein